ncbi:hypothetical protein R6Q57_019911 [Mikania cordata]
MPQGILLSSQSKKPFHHRNGSDELDVFEAAGYFSGVSENFSNTQRNMRPIRRMSLDMPNHIGNSIPLQSMLIETPTIINKEKKFKQPSSPGGKLAHFLNSLFNQTSKSKSKKKSTKDENESPGGWRRKRRSSISHFRSGNTNSAANNAATATISAGFRTPPPSTKTTNHLDSRIYSYLKPPSTQITKIPITKNFNKIEHFDIKNDLPVKNMSFRNGFVEKVKTFDEKHHHNYKYVSREDMQEIKMFIDNDDGADSDSSSDLFELTNYDTGYCSSGLPVYETTHMDRTNRSAAAPISS